MTDIQVITLGGLSAQRCLDALQAMLVADEAKRQVDEPTPARECIATPLATELIGQLLAFKSRHQFEQVRE